MTPSPKAASVSQGVDVTRKALEKLLVTARRVSSLGAQCGRQWVDLSFAILEADAALSASPEAPSLDAAVPASGGVEPVATVIYDAMGYDRSGAVVDIDGIPHGSWKIACDAAIEIIASLSPAPTSGSEAGGEAVVWLSRVDAQRALSALDVFMGDTDPIEDTPAVLACQALSRALAKPASEPAGGVREALALARNALLSSKPKMAHYEEPRARHRAAFEAVERALTALSAPASSSPAEAEAKEGRG